MPGPLVGRDEPSKLLVQHLELVIEGTEEVEQRRDHRGERRRVRVTEALVAMVTAGSVVDDVDPV